MHCYDVFRQIFVALLAEGVDRNVLEEMVIIAVLESPSSRRAWIEIIQVYNQTASAAVALLAEGVDRNRSAITTSTAPAVALLAEGVDRNLEVMDTGQALTRRPPRGGRG